MRDKIKEDLDKLKSMDERELREYGVPWPHDIEELTKIIEAMAEREHEYGTCVYAMSISAVAAFNYISHKLGVTGFQASCADKDILARTRNLQWGRLLNYEDLLYPQKCNKEHFPNAETLFEENSEELAKRAKKLIKEVIDNDRDVHPDVLDHWLMLITKGQVSKVKKHD